MLAQGRIIIPRPPHPLRSGSVYLKSVDAAVNLKQGVGDISLSQVFYNDSQFRLEGEYLFPLPGESQVHDFHLYINGQKTRGQVLDSREALQTYTDIVRTMRDPALLEFSGYGLFKARIFPIEPNQDRKIEMQYAQVVSYDSRAFRFVFPIRQSGQGNIEHFHLAINLETDSPLAQVYSPSHRIEVTRDGDRRATVTVEENNLVGNKDFILYYTLADQEIDATVLNFRPRTDRDGFFMLMVAPVLDDNVQKQAARDFIFVTDVSGSMGGEKIRQAREALRYCINTLQPQDRFEIIRFSSAVENFQNGLQPAGREQIQNALYFIDNMSASGGTNINEALQRALRLKNERDRRPTSIVFLTDGLPTEGVTDVGAILRNVQNEQKDFIRIFSFGVGYDVNTFLLDKLSGDSHGSANYVKPGENIEKEVSAFFAHISSPVLTAPKIDFGRLQVYDVYPQNLPDIFRGQRLTIIGRYRGEGKAEIRLTGKQGERTKSFTYDVELANRESENEFIAALWANRKVSHLLTQIRFYGENEELVESVRSLGKEYGIVTPYTSYLVTEQEKELAQIRLDVNQGNAPPTLKYMQSIQNARESQAVKDEESVGSATFYDALMEAPRAAAKSSGKGAVLSSRLLKKIATAEKETDMILTIRRIGDKTFTLRDGTWMENGLEDIRKADRQIVFLSDEYFTLSRKDGQLRRILALGDKVWFRWEGKTYQVAEKF
ncbi:MAG: VWA domain-containing protein [Calditrichia bacterium]